MILIQLECQGCGWSDEEFFQPPLPRVGASLSCPKCGKRRYRRLPPLPCVEAFIPLRDVRLHPTRTFQSKEELKDYLKAKQIDRPHPTMFGGTHEINRNYRKPRIQPAQPQKGRAQSIGGQSND